MAITSWKGRGTAKPSPSGKHLHGRSDSMSMSRGHVIHVVMRQIEAPAPDQLKKIRNELSRASDPTMLYAVTENGYVFLTVIYDDGKLQKKMDQVYGPRIVAVESALRPAI
jgi:hypothetical protein